MPGFLRKTSDPMSQPFHDQIALVGALLQANKERMSSGQSHWDRWFEIIAKLPAEERANFPEEAATVAAIEAAASDIVIERDKLSSIRDAAMHEKIRQLAMGSASAGLPVGDRISSDFASFRAWRTTHLDGVDCDMFALVDQRKPSRPLKRGERRQLFDALFIAWAKAAGILVRDAETAAREKLSAEMDERNDDHSGFRP